MNSRRQLLVTSAAILSCLLIFSVTPLDYQVQAVFYNTGKHAWLWPRNEPVLRFLLYDGIKILLIVFTLALVLLLFAGGNTAWVQRNRTGIRIVVLSMIMAPLSVSLLKMTTHIPCPKNLTLFGGDLPYTDLLTHLFNNKPRFSEQQCFPAGHASGGFALMSLYFLFDSPGAQRWALVLALVIGWLMGLYKMAIGDHFLSHTLMSMLIDWFVINSLFLLDNRVFNTEPHTIPQHFS